MDLLPQLERAAQEADSLFAHRSQTLSEFSVVKESNAASSWSTSTAVSLKGQSESGLHTKTSL